MFLCFLLSISFSRKPIYLIPGFTGASLYATITDSNLYPSCPPFINHFQIFPVNKSFQLQYSQCLGLLYSTIYNSENNQISSLPGIIIESDSFGNTSSFDSFSNVVSHLVSDGYVINETLFGVPYDWIHYYPGTIKIFSNLKNHIEMISGQLKEKVILFGHSMGSHLLRLLFSNYTDSDWAKKYVDRVILSSPAFYGCSGIIELVITGILDDEKEANEDIAYSIRHMPSSFLLFENFNINKDKLFFANSSAGVKSASVHEFLEQVGLLDDLSMKIFSSIEPSLIQKPTEFPVKTLLFYNSGLPTPASFNATTLERIEGRGDGFCHSDVLDILCSKWKHTKCIDWKSNETRFDHAKMLSSKEELTMISKFLNENDDL